MKKFTFLTTPVPVCCLAQKKEKRKKSLIHVTTPSCFALENEKNGICSIHVTASHRPISKKFRSPQPIFNQ